MLRSLIPVVFGALFLAACAHPPARTDGAPLEAGPEAAEMGEMCSGIAGIACADEGAYCRKDVGACRIPDAAGVCARKARFCTQNYDPVCGCDGKTYGNGCTARAAGVNVLHEGACADPE